MSSRRNAQMNIRSDKPEAPSLARTTLTPSEYLRVLWSHIEKLDVGDAVNVECEDVRQAESTQRWFFRERKRQKRMLIDQGLHGGMAFDPDAADLLAGTTCRRVGTLITIAKPTTPRFATIKRADGKSEKVSLRR